VSAFLFLNHVPTSSNSSGTDVKADFEFDDFFAQFKDDGGGCEVGSTVLYADMMDSTQNVVQSVISDVPKGFLCVANRQTKGRGRGSNEWTSPPGCLLFTFVTRFPITMGTNLPFMQYLVGLAVIESIRSLDPCCEHLDLNLKWPNDIYANKSKKIGGVLCQSSLFRRTFEVAIGVGLNIDNSEPSTCLNDLFSSSSSSMKRRLTRGEVLGRFCVTFQNMLDVFVKRGFSPFESSYYRYWLHTDQHVHAVVDEDTNEQVSMRVKGLTKQGALLAEELTTGRKHELYPDGNRFDFLKGLVSKKKK